MRTGMAIESWFVAQKKIPEAIAGIASSAIDNIFLMFDRQIPIFLYRPSHAFYKEVSMEEKINETVDGHAKYSSDFIEIYNVT